MSRLKELFKKEIKPNLKQQFGYKNHYMVPELQKIVLNMGLGIDGNDSKILKSSQDDLAAITGQKPIITKFRKSISNFKTRKNTNSGLKVTLRKNKMYEFIDRLVNIALPRVKDFRGLSPNGFDGKEICAISRYAGISNKVSSFGVYNYKSNSEASLSSMLIAQMIWYFIEGLDGRINDDNFTDENSYQKYITLVDDYELIFYKSLKTGRWWMEIPFSSSVNNKLKKHTLLPCDKKDYDLACSNIVPERWYKAQQKNNV